jgi:hypothetical protein
VMQAYCSECGGYVALDSSGTCPRGHARSCYRDVRDSGPQQSGAPASSLPATRDGASQTSVQSPGRRPWLWVIAAVLGVGLVLAACIGAVFVGRLALSRNRAGAVQTSASTASTAQSTPATPQANRIQASADGRYPPVLKASGKHPRPSRRQQLWALATCGILTEANGERHDLLGGASKTPGNVRLAKQVLSQQWDIHNRRDLLAQLSWIEKGGHRRDFDTITYAVATPGQLEKLNAQADENPSLANAVEVARGSSGRLGARSISGWDYARYVFLCRRGYLVGYLTEGEAWSRIMPAARVMQSTFRSWRELGDNYLIGRRFWSAQATKASGAQMRQAEARLLSDRQSPWVRLPWRLDLTDN